MAGCSVFLKYRTRRVSDQDGEPDAIAAKRAPKIRPLTDVELVATKRAASPWAKFRHIPPPATLCGGVRDGWKGLSRADPGVESNIRAPLSKSKGAHCKIV
jgi:hypothetical protein